MNEVNYSRYRDQSVNRDLKKTNKKKHLTWIVIFFSLLIIFIPSTSADSNTIKFIAYYGWLNCSNMDWANSGLTLVIIADDNKAEIQQIQSANVDVYFYKALGSTYASASDKNNWEQNIKEFIDSHDYVEGFFWDEVDPGYYGQSSKDDFNRRLTAINDHVRMNGQKTIANGVRYYADHCGNDYYMWESFMSTFRGSCATPDYYYVDFFTRTVNDNDPYKWINNIAKWEYLQKSTGLDKTLAHCYGDPSDDDTSNYDYIAARVLGLKGFSYVNANNFAARDMTLTEGMKWNLGVLIDSNIDEKNQRLSGQFTGGGVEDDIEQTISTENAVYSFTTPTPDASPTEESTEEHYKEKKGKHPFPPFQINFLKIFNVLIIIVIAVIVQVIILRGKIKR